MIDKPINVSDAEFEAKVLQSDLPVIVDFWAPWCGPCRMIAPILEKIASEYAGKLIVAKVNTDENPEWVTKFGVQGIPTMLFIHNGHLHNHQVGAVPEAFLRDLVEDLLEAEHEIPIH
ncbi:MAG: thioredoxin [Anaerolineales bacterium]|nr:thioredoxin [Anaerolineales bacterium]